MELLSYLIEKRKQSAKQYHPFAHTTEYFRKLYAFGIGILALGHMNAIEETKTRFMAFLASLELPEDFYDSIIVDINNNFEYRLNDVFTNMDTKQKQYCFCLDLYLIAEGTEWAKKYAEEIIKCYTQGFRFSVRESDFFKNFMTYAKENDLSGARKVYSQFLAQRHLISYQILTYAYPNFQMQDVFHDLMIDTGELVMFDKPTILNGQIKISNSSVLNIEHADIVLNGSILIDGGKLIINDSNIQVNSADAHYAISMKNTAGIIMEDMHLDAGNHSGFLHQEDGTLVLRNCTFKNASGYPGIYFSGRHLEMEDCRVANCDCGGIYNTQNAELTIWNSKFKNCNAENGGAVYSNSLYDVSIKECSFSNCNAKYNGGAVYFKNQKYGQSVKNCKTKDCNPPGSIIFNNFEEISE